MIPLHDDNPITIKPYLTIGTIVLCSLVFLWQISQDQPGFQRAVLSMGAIPAVLFGRAELDPALYIIPAELTLFTSMFMHGGWMHLIGNMLYLWIFGNNIEDVMGHGRYVMFYLLCGLVAALGHALLEPASEIPMIGASGAISGVLGAYLLIYPHARVFVIVPMGIFSRGIYLPAVLVLGFWFILQIINSAVATTGQGGVAWFAHIGGFIAGMALIPLFKHKHVRLFNPAHHKRGRW